MPKLLLSLLLVSSICFAGEVTVRQSKHSSKIFETKLASEQRKAEQIRQQQLELLRAINPLISRCFSFPLENQCRSICIDGICPNLDDYLDSIGIAPQQPQR
ncbi:hypothetical protein [Paraferrimonas sp. SM1919]|uniref:hypothetical protein n=1 Tax=Paraferrimonas sp. SM1919 TaxID=2662263 RepID=UPI0013D62242|nr:hypothetical protein [Paraferrimonas sp. SM1919]